MRLPLILVLVFFGFASNAHATTFGMNIVLRTDAEMAKVRALGCREVRMDMDWNTTESVPGVYWWGYTDQGVASASRAGLRVLPIVSYTPTWMGTPFSAPSLDAYISFIREAVARYGVNGRFWAENPSVPYRPIYRWEIWNEANWTFWTGTPQQYAVLYSTARSALHALGPYTAILGGLAYPGARAWLKAIWPALAKVDAVGYHPYAAHASGALRLIQSMGRLLSNLGARRVPLDIGETGSPVPPYTEHSRRRYLKRLAILIRDYRRVKHLDVYAWQSDDAFAIRGTPSAGAYAYGIAHPR